MDKKKKHMIIFDLDGTLWDSSTEVADSWNVMIEEETGKEDMLSAEDISAEMGRTMTQIADDLFSFLSEDDRYDLAHKCEVYENEYIRESGALLYPGVRETLDKLLADGYEMAVVSNCQEDYVAAFLESMDMDKYFVDYEEWGRTGLLKADNIRLVMERNDEDKAVYVGDIQSDSDAAEEAGIPCIYASYGFGDMENPTATIDSFDELPEVLDELGFGDENLASDA